MKKGKCKLCLFEKPLCKSHLIPRAVYALCRAQKAPNPNPMMVTHTLALQTSRQAQWPLLCFSCEQLLREKGEDWVLPQLAQYGDIFPFGETLKASPHLFDEPDVAAYALDGHPTLRAANLVHFAMGIFWKGSVHTWLAKRSEPWLNLQEYREPMRKFLLGEADFPAHMALSLAIPVMPVRLIGFYFPFETTDGLGSSTFHLYVPGFNFTLWTGPDIPREIAQCCLSKRPHLTLVYDVAPYVAKRYRDALADVKKSGARRRMERSS